MRNIYILTFLLWVLPAFFVSAGNPFFVKKPAAIGRNFCQIYGSVYLERDPKRQAGTQFTVYEESEDAFANLVVYKEDNKLFADEPGLWYLAPNRDFADFVIFVTPNRNLADFGVYFTKTRSFAGCKN
ncbi:DUF6150 family protein [Adhaeribacter soli]|uniref:DUF6150 family protein n=1 Tax=Adhaeribacter soli TaxID=2607655 RepID=UPI001CD92C91|nr:DUF6150 family protein [Adhaeribacter soli]